MFENWNNLEDWIKALILFWGCVAPVLFLIGLLIVGADDGK